MSLLLGVLGIAGILFVANFFGSQSSLSLLNFSDGFFSKSLFVVGLGSFDFSDIVKGDSFNGSLLSEDFLFLIFALIGQLKFFVESSPGSGPSESLGFKFSR